MTSWLTQWLGRSLRRRLLVPVLACGVAVAAASLLVIRWEASRRLAAELEHRAAIVGNLVNYAAESAEGLPALQRFVTQAGAEQDVLDIVVVGGTPARVLASTHGAWVGRLLAELPGAEVADDLARAIALDAPHQHFNPAEHLYDRSMPLLLSLPALTDGSLASGAVMVHLDTRAMEAEVLASTLQLALAVTLSFGLMAAVAYRRLDTTVLAPLAHIERAIVAHDAASDDVWAPANSGDELGSVARTLRESMLARAASEAALRHSERMASVGTLAGGIAHEINTPLQFVSDGVHFLRDASEEVIVAIAHVAAEVQAVDAATATDDLRRVVTSVASLVEDVDVDYLAERVPKAAARSVDGVERVQSIVASLKACADPTPRDMRPEDINRVVQNALIAADEECRRVATVVMDFAALPPVRCHAGDVYQALTHIIQNAAEAIARVADTRGGLGEIVVRTRRDGDAVLISVRDTGSGIPAEAGPHVFDPFFTTKEVGQGTGQGLTVAWSMVTERHGGRLWFETTAAGTTFFVRLPFVQQSSAVFQERAA